MRALLAAAVLTAGCADGGAEASGGAAASAPEVRDSAGVRIVENAGPARPGALAVGAEPLWRVGWEEGGLALQNVPWGVLLPDGGAAFTDAGASRVHLIGPDGSVRASVGRPGEGPGEFQNISGLALAGSDSLVVYDFGNRRLTWIGTDGAFGRSERSGVGRLSLDGVTDGGTLLFSTYFISMTSGEPGPARVPNPLVAAPVDDPAALDTVAMPDGVAVHRDSQGRPGSISFSPYGFTDTYEDGWVHAPGDVAEVVWYDAAGGVVQRARWPADPLPLNDSVRSAYLDHAVESFGGDDPEAARAQFEEMLARQQADHLPPVHLPVTGPGGETWAGVYPVLLFSVPRLHQVVLGDGTYLGTVEVPPRFRLLDVGEDRVLGVQQDDLDVQSVVAFPLSRGGG